MDMLAKEPLDIPIHKALVYSQWLLEVIPMVTCPTLVLLL